MKQIHHLCSICFSIAFALLLFSCAADSKTKNSTSEKSLNKNNQPVKDSVAEEKLSASSVAIKREEYVQASNGLEYTVVQYYMDLYNKGELRSIVKGSSRKMDLENNKVYLDTKLMAYNGLGFFHGKYPEFLIASEDSVVTPDNSLFTNTEVNCELFTDGKASDYLLHRENYNLGDLQIMISKAFYYKGAYYVHAWELSNSTEIFHHQRMTYKFDKNTKIIDKAGINTYQMGYSKAAQYLKDQDTPEDQITTVYM